MKAIEGTYTGEYARNYDASRSDTIEWARENRAIEPMLRMIPRGHTVLDIAAGTGRWLHIYADIGARPTLIDASRDMLDQAQRKATQLGLPISLVTRSALEAAPFPQTEWAVVTRFFNWIPLALVESVLAKCISAGTRNFIFMLTYLPASTGRTSALKARYATFRRNTARVLGLREKGVYYLHSEGAARQMLAKLGLTIKVERIIADSRGRRTVMMHASRESDLTTPPITIIDRCHFGGDRCVVNGQRHTAKKGSWTFYIPTLELKLLHAVDNRVHCIHRSAPNRAALFSGDPEVPLSAHYTVDDWANALSKTVVRRAIENYIAANRLYEAGLGPEPFGLCLVREFTANYGNTPCQTAGFFVRDARRYRRKNEATVEEVIAAGVVPDRLMSCVREQINGYVSDLNSVVGVVPTGADALISQMEHDVQLAVSGLG